jgi:hypothetical protein
MVCPCPCQQYTHAGRRVLAKSRQRHTNGYIITTGDLLNLCLGPQVVDGQRVEGALRPFGVPGLVSLS